MPSRVLRPTSDAVVATWTSDLADGILWDKLDEAIAQPAAPSTASDFIQATATGAARIEVEDYTLLAGETVTGVTLWAYGANSTGGNLQLQIYKGATTLGVNTNMTTTLGWQSVTFTGALTQAEVNSLRAYFNCSANTANPKRLYAAYMVLSTTLPAASASDMVAVSDQATRTSTLSRTPFDSVAVTDMATRLQTAARFGSEVVAVFDSVARQVSGQRTAVEVVAVADVSARTEAAARSGSDSAAVVDSASRTVFGARTAADSVALADAAGRTVTEARTVQDTAAVADVASRQVVAARAASDAVDIADVASTASVNARAASDALAVSDGASRAVNFTRTATDTVSVGDSAARGANRTRAVDDQVTVADAATYLRLVARTATDSAAIVDSAGTSVTFTRQALEPLLLVFDAASGTAHHFAPPGPIYTGHGASTATGHPGGGIGIGRSSRRLGVAGRADAGVTMGRR